MKPTIVVLCEDTSNTQAMQRSKGYFEKREGIAVEYDLNSFEVAGQKANQDLSNGTGLYDILLQYNFSLASFVLNDWVLKIDDFNKVLPDFEARRLRVGHLP